MATLTVQDRAFDALLRERFGSAYLGWTGGAYVHDIGGGFVSRPRGAAVRGYVVHHSAGPAGQGGDAIWRFHVQSRGWETAGYAVFIRADGRVELLIPPSLMSYSVGEHNPYWTAVCLAGNFEANDPPAVQVDALYRVLCALDDAYGSLPWRAHREVMPGHTACPGARLLPHLKKMRGKAFGAAVPRPEHYA